MGKKINLLLIFIGLFFIAQGLFKFRIVPIGLTSMIFGAPYSAKLIDFFVYIFLYFILKFFLAINGLQNLNQFIQKNFEIYIKGNKEFEIPEVKKYGPYGGKVAVFKNYIFDFFTFVFTFTCSMMIAGYLASIGYIANNEQEMYPMMLNFFLGFTIIFKYFT